MKKKANIFPANCWEAIKKNKITRIMVREDATLGHIFNFMKFISVHDMKSNHIVTYHNTEKSVKN